MAIQARLRKWGNSFGIVVPIDIVEKEKMKEGEEVIVEIEKKNSIKELFGTLKNWKIDAQRVKDEIRKEESKDDKLLS